MTVYKKWPCISTGNTRPIDELCIGTQLPSCDNGHSICICIARK